MASYDVKPESNVTKYTSNLRVVNAKYNSLGITIPKEIVDRIGLMKGDRMEFEVVSKKDNKVDIDIQFIKQ